MTPNPIDGGPSHPRGVRWIVLSSVALALSSALLMGKAVAGTSPIPDAPIPAKTGFLTDCLRFENQRRVNCYVRRLLAIVERAGDPSRELPRIDRKVHRVGGYLEGACHSLMHVVGRNWARRHGVTLETMYHYVPRSNDPGCSAGFGMGMVIYLGTRIILDPRSVVPTCERLPTRFREYTCIHGTGHALMRGYHGLLAGAVHACTQLGPRFAPDCAQGAFHDYWISLGGGDGTMQQHDADASPRSVCGSTTFIRPCWYRFFWERMPEVRVYEPQDITRLCAHLSGMQRAGCVAGASLSMSRTRVAIEHAHTCGLLEEGADALNCIRGVVVPAVAGQFHEQLELIHTCDTFSKETMWGCYSWFGRTLSVVTDGRFERVGCRRLDPPHARYSCVAGARRMREALATFS